MMNFRGLFLTATLALAATGVSSAATIVQSFSLPTGGLTPTTWSGNALINTFDTNLGVLDYIRIQSSMFAVATAGAVDATGSTAGSDSYSIRATTTVSLKDPSSALLVAPSTTVSSTYLNQSNGSVMSVTTSGTVNSNAIWSVNDDPINNPFSACQSVLLLPAGCLNNSSGTAAPVDPLDYLNYMSNGAGTITLTASAASEGAFGGANFSNAFATGSANINVTVTYGYHVPPPPPSTPEPATLALFGSGLVGVGLLRRKFRKA